MNDKMDIIVKRKKINIFRRFSNRISKYFHKSKRCNKKIDEERNLSKSLLEDLHVESTSHDDLRSKKTFQKKKKPFGLFLNSVYSAVTRGQKTSKNVLKKSDRCLSEGDLINNDCDCSSKTYPSRTHDSITTCHGAAAITLQNAFSQGLSRSFKNELALKLRAKNQSKDNDSDYSKTPDSIIDIQTGASPPGHQFVEARTPQSMSSLSHSSNSLLSGNNANVYGTSDAESMSRSVIDSFDDSGIVVDLSTPISKTTNAALLDVSAARQKIAASKNRRVRPKLLVKDNEEKIVPIDSVRFSPVRDKRDILEEIREEDSSILSSSMLQKSEHPVPLAVDNKIYMATSGLRSSANTKLLIQDNVPLTHKIVSIKLDSSSVEFPITKPNETIKDSNACNPDSARESFNLRKSKFQTPNDKPIIDRSADSKPKFNIKLRPTGNNNQSISSERTNDRKNERSSVVLCGKSLIAKEEECAPKINRYSAIRTFADTKRKPINK